MKSVCVLGAFAIWKPCTQTKSQPDSANSKTLPFPHLKNFRAFHAGGGFLKVLALPWPHGTHVRFQHKTRWKPRTRMFTHYIQIKRSYSNNCAFVGISCLFCDDQHFSITLLSNTSLQHSSPKLFSNSLPQDSFPSPQHHPQHSSPTLLQHSSPTLLYNTHSSPALLSNTLPQHFSTTIFSNTFSNTSLQHFSTSLFSNTLLQHSPPTLLFNNSLQHFSTTIFSNNSLQHVSKTSPQHFLKTLLHNTSPQHFFTTLLHDIPS